MNWELVVSAFLGTLGALLLFYGSREIFTREVFFLSGGRNGGKNSKSGGEIGERARGRTRANRIRQDVAGLEWAEPLVMTEPDETDAQIFEERAKGEDE